jgi:hypothetical protein
MLSDDQPLRSLPRGWLHGCVDRLLDEKLMERVWYMLGCGRRIVVKWINYPDFVPMFSWEGS